MQSSPLSLRSLFSTIFFSCLSLVSLCRLVFGGVSVSWTPPLTDNSLDGTLLCTVQCTAILPQWALGLWWMVRITHTPLGGEWYLPDGGRGGEVCVMVFWWGWIVPCLLLGNWGQLESLWFQTCDMEQDVGYVVCVCVIFLLFCFCSATRWYTACHVNSRGLGRYVCQCLLWWCPPSPLLLWGLLQSKCSGLHHSSNCYMRACM